MIQRPPAAHNDDVCRPETEENQGSNSAPVLSTVERWSGAVSSLPGRVPPTYLVKS